MRVRAMSLRGIFPAGRFAPPATTEQITAAERELGVRLPDQLRVLYLECDGFREPRGNAKYLFALFEGDSVGGLVSWTKFWWQEWREIAPNLELDFTPFVFFGSSNSDHAWGIRWQGPAEIIAYHHHMEGEYEVVGSDILAVYQQDYAGYDELDE
jgi:hypothetical protein